LLWCGKPNRLLWNCHQSALVGLVLQGGKRGMMSSKTFDLCPGASLPITTEVPAMSHHRAASLARPYVSV